MRARCPACGTIFRVTSGQLSARAGKVRCGQCHAVFNALESLLDDEPTVETPAGIPPAGPENRPSAGSPLVSPPGDPGPLLLPEVLATAGPAAEVVAAPLATEVARAAGGRAEPPPRVALLTSESAVPHTGPSPVGQPAPAGESAWPGPGLDAGRGEGTSAGDAESRPATEAIAAQRPYRFAAGLLALVLAAQIVYWFRTPIANSLPRLRPPLEALSQVLGSDMPLSRHADLLSIESSDLHADPSRDRLLALQATLRNRATYAQAYPALELTLTDTSDRAIARRVLMPDEYLPGSLPDDSAFAPLSEVEVRLWLEAREIGAAGYRLYVFYP